LAVDGQGKFLYVSNVSGLLTSQVAVFTILGTSITPISGSPFSSNLQQMQGEASGKFMVATTSNFGAPDNNVHVMSINSSTGVLTEVGTGFPTQATPELVSVQPNAGGTLVYAVDFNGDVEGASIDLNSGVLTAVAGSPFAISGLSAKYDPAGKYLFVVEGTNLDHASLFAYDVSASSALSTAVASVGWAAGDWQAFDTQ